MPFHAEHHRYPALPFHALPRAHRTMAPKLVHVDRGYWSVHRQIIRSFRAAAKATT
jgi:fatty acid desaturase